MNNHVFTNFEFKADVMTTPGSNSGMYFHTEFQEGGWPAKGYEVQVNNSPHRLAPHRRALCDRRRQGTAGQRQHVVHPAHHRHRQARGIKVDGKVTAEYTEPANVERPADMAGRKLGSGTFALQGHDPKSKVFYKNIMVKPLP